MAARPSGVTSVETDRQTLKQAAAETARS